LAKVISESLSEAFVGVREHSKTKDIKVDNSEFKPIADSIWKSTAKIPRTKSQ
jgi:hypothetical protein